MCFFHIYFQVSNYTYLVGLLLVFYFTGFGYLLYKGHPTQGITRKVTMDY